MTDRVKCFVCMGKDSDLLADYDVQCNVCGAGCGDVLDAAWDTIEQLEQELAQARAELERAKAGYQEWCAFLNDQLDRSDANKPKSLGRGEAYGVYFAMGSAEDLFGESLGVIRDDMCKEA